MSYIVEPKKNPKDMTEIEAFEWELACVLKRIELINKDMNLSEARRARALDSYNIRRVELETLLKQDKDDHSYTQTTPVILKAEEQKEPIEKPFDLKAAKEQVKDPVNVIRKESRKGRKKAQVIEESIKEVEKKIEESIETHEEVPEETHEEPPEVLENTSENSE